MEIPFSGNFHPYQHSARCTGHCPAATFAQLQLGTVGSLRGCHYTLCPAMSFSTWKQRQPGPVTEARATQINPHRPRYPLR